jgi:predicted nucleic acid-binding protein
VAVPVALFDANVLTSMTITDLAIECAHRGLFAARWSEEIHREWIEAVAKLRPDIPMDRLHRRRELMDLNTADCFVMGYEALIEGLKLPDPDDRHVLAAAIKANCSAIVTFNLKDFPLDALHQHSIDAIHPDSFFVSVLTRDAEGLTACVAATRARLKNPPHTVDEHLARIEKAGLPKLSKALAELKPLL